MTQRLDPYGHSKQLFGKLLALSQAVRATLDDTTLDLVNVRASQLNGCAFCTDMHVKESMLHGDGELRLHHVATWRESPLFNDRERAALAWTEAVTRLGPDGVSDADYAAARAIFDEETLTTLTFAVATINAWNRLNVAFRTVPGSSDALLGLDRARLREPQAALRAAA